MGFKVIHSELIFYLKKYSAKLLPADFSTLHTNVAQLSRDLNSILYKIWVVIILPDSLLHQGN